MPRLNKRSWIFNLHELYFPIATVRVKGNAISFISHVWAYTFGLNKTSAVMTSFWITDFELFIHQKKIVFYGDYMYSDRKVIYFVTELPF